MKSSQQFTWTITDPAFFKFTYFIIMVYHIQIFFDQLSSSKNILCIIRITFQFLKLFLSGVHSSFRFPFPNHGLIYGALPPSEWLMVAADRRLHLSKPWLLQIIIVECTFKTFSHILLIMIWIECIIIWWNFEIWHFKVDVWWNINNCNVYWKNSELNRLLTYY